MPFPLPLELVENLRTFNPWWRGEPGLSVPSLRRWPFAKLKRMATEGLTPATVLRGPRRVGKTILLHQLIASFLAEGVAPSRILYVPFDDLPTLGDLREPVLAISRWFERAVLGGSFNAAARAGEPALLFFDEVQNLGYWAEQLKNLADNQMVRVMVTGSSSLRIEAGRDSLAGRITTLDLGPLLLREIAELRFGHSSQPGWANNGMDQFLSMDFWHEAVAQGQGDREVRLAAFSALSERGAYPTAQERSQTPWHEMADYLNETVIKRAIQHDLRMGPRGQQRDEALLEEVFRLCCRYAGQTPGMSVFVPEIQQALSESIGWNRILNYLRFLDSTLLVRLIPPLEIRLKKKNKSPAKVCLCDHALRASWLQEIVPISPSGLAANPHLTDLAGHLVESILGYYLASIPHLDISYFPARGIDPEVDFVMTIGTRRIPIEVKYRKRIDYHEDTRGLRAFLEKTVYNAPFGLLVTLEDEVVIPDPRIIPISLSSLLWIR